MKAVEREYAAMRQAADRFLAEVGRDPSILRGDARARDLERASGHLEGTYVMRLFAEFETGLRDYWKTVRRTQPSTKHLIDSIATQRHVPTDVIRDVHAVREYRNDLVHEREDAGDRIPIPQCRRRLCQFFGRLPVEW
jgi:hypothetical protein